MQEINLLWWRPCFLDMAMQTFVTPSGLVRGSVEGRRAPRRFIAGGEEEEQKDSMAFRLYLCRVLLARVLQTKLYFLSSLWSFIMYSKMYCPRQL